MTYSPGSLGKVMAIKPTWNWLPFIVKIYSHISNRTTDSVRNEQLSENKVSAQFLNQLHFWYLLALQNWIDLTNMKHFCIACNERRNMYLHLSHKIRWIY